MPTSLNSLLGGTYTGPSGFSGFSGSGGASGFSGLSGFSGFSGSGISGWSGFSGISGWSGWSGVTPTTLIVSISDETTNLTTGTAKVTFRAAYAMSITQIPRASLSTASTSGAVTVDINIGGTSILGANKLSIDANEKTSTTAATATTLATNPTSVSDDAEFTIDIDGAGTGAKGLKVTIYYTKT